MNSVKIPENDTSDIEKNHIRIFQTFFRIILTSVEINCGFLVSQRNSPYFGSFIKYMISHFELNIDKNIKKSIANILKNLVIDFSGLSASPANLALFGKKASS